MKPTTIKAVIFDLDGTLVDSSQDIAAALNKVLQTQGQELLSHSTAKKLVEAGKGANYIISQAFQQNGVQYSKPFLDERLKEYLQFYQEEPAQRTQLFPYVKEDLEALRKAGLVLGVCTNKPHNLTLLVLEKLGVSHFFHCVIGAGIVERPKPHQDHLLAVIEKLEVEADQTFYVGDSEVDRACAYAARVPFFLVSWGGGSTMDTQNDTRIQRLSDLIPFTSQSDF